MSYLRTTLAVTGILVTTFALAGCSSSQPMGGMGGMTGDSSSSASVGDFNRADVMFTQMMIPHHEQAVTMSDLILTKKGIESRVIELATNIKSAQGPEITTMKSWLKTWGASDSGMSGMDHGSSGMMSDSEMTGLEAATGTDAARLFLTGMTAHHEGAIVMAETEVTGGKNADAIALAKEIIAAQTSEITIMKEILTSL